MPSLQIIMHHNLKNNKIKVERGVRQVDTMSPKHFTVAPEDVFKKKHSWENKNKNRIPPPFSVYERYSTDIRRFTWRTWQKPQVVWMMDTKINTLDIKQKGSKADYNYDDFRRYSTSTWPQMAPEKLKEGTSHKPKSGWTMNRGNQGK